MRTRRREQYRRKKICVGSWFKHPTTSRSSRRRPPFVLRASTHAGTINRCARACCIDRSEAPTPMNRTLISTCLGASSAPLCGVVLLLLRSRGRLISGGRDSVASDRDPRSAHAGTPSQAAGAGQAILALLGLHTDAAFSTPTTLSPISLPPFLLNRNNLLSHACTPAAGSRGAPTRGEQQHQQQAPPPNIPGEEQQTHQQPDQAPQGLAFRYVERGDGTAGLGLLAGVWGRWWLMLRWGSPGSPPPTRQCGAYDDAILIST